MDVYGAFPGLGQYHNPKIYGKVICMWYMLDFPRLPSVGIPNGGGPLASIQPALLQV